jgi:homoserine kinase
MQRTRTVFAPATVANVTVGFDILGFAVDAVGDEVTAERVDGASGVEIESIEGVVTDLPRDPARNTASVAVRALIDVARPGCGFRLRIRKGIPLGSGMGGSAASAVGAVVAASGLLDRPLSREALLPFALAGEAVASGAPHADNAAPCLFGGLTAVVAHEPLRVVQVPLPQGLQCVLVHPHMRLDTREARAVLRPSVTLGDHVEQSIRLAGFLVGCFRGDTDLVGASMEDCIVEPQRARLIPGYAAARTAALEAGALGFGIAGSGPSLFAWVEDRTRGRAVESALRRVFAEHGLESDGWLTAIRAEGAG